MAANEVRQIRANGNDKVETIQDKVDRTKELELKKKKLDVEITALKEEIRVYGKSNKQRVVDGHRYYAEIGDKTSTDVPVREFAGLLRDLGFKDRYNECVKVLIGEAKKIVGETMLKKISKVSVEKWEGSVSIKEKK